MKVIIPMAGTGNRFVQKGYKDPKPLIKVNNKKIIEYILDIFDEKDEIYFICNKTHLNTTTMREDLLELRPDAKVLMIDDHKKGPIYTVMPFIDLVDDEEEVMVCYCDNPYLWDYEKFKHWADSTWVDGCILTHTDFHPHRLSSTYMAYCKLDSGTDKLQEIKEKEPYTDNHWTEHASTGTYYFRKGKYIKKYFKEAVENKVKHTNGEYYVTLVYNLLVRDGLDVRVYDTDYVTVFGTPEEVQNFEAWQTILKGTQVKNEKDLIKVYNYWRKYNENYISQG